VGGQPSREKECCREVKTVLGFLVLGFLVILISKNGDDTDDGGDRSDVHDDRTASEEMRSFHLDVVATREQLDVPMSYLGR